MPLDIMGADGRELFDSRMIQAGGQADLYRFFASTLGDAEVLRALFSNEKRNAKQKSRQRALIVEDLDVSASGQVSLTLGSGRRLNLSGDDGEWLLYQDGKVLCYYFFGKGLIERIRR